MDNNIIPRCTVNAVSSTYTTLFGRAKSAKNKQNFSNGHLYLLEI